jgi:nucleoside-diphosphate-sugar epimerase
MPTTVAAIRHLEKAVLRAGGTAGIVLRYGTFYGSGTPMTPGGAYFETIRERKFPIVGNGGSVWSFHFVDATEATVSAVEHGSRGV